MYNLLGMADGIDWSVNDWLIFFFFLMAILFIWEDGLIIMVSGVLTLNPKCWVIIESDEKC